MILERQEKKLNRKYCGESEKNSDLSSLSPH
jgi:hypothetical protein